MFKRRQISSAGMPASNLFTLLIISDSECVSFLMAVLWLEKVAPGQGRIGFCLVENGLN